MRPCMLNEWVKKNVPTNPDFLWASAKKFFAMADVHFTLGELGYGIFFCMCDPPL